MNLNFPTLFPRSRRVILPVICLSLMLSVAGVGRAAQAEPEPRRETLLNGLRVLLWPRPGDANVILKLRIHSGGAFDLAGKSGQMALLGDALFPSPATREYFTDELGGRLEVTTDYDAINVTLAGRAVEFEHIVQQLRSAILNMQLDAGTVAKLREARVKVVRETSISPAQVADRAIAARLFGDFPYGRPFMGTTDTLARIDRADLMLARERFLTADNSTLVIIGGVEERRAMRALRQLLGSWRKSEQIVPATFRQPDAPEASTLIIDLPGTETAEVRLATRGLARADRDYAAAQLLALLARDRWQAALPELGKSPFFVRHEAHVLPGIFVMGASVRTAAAAQALSAARSVIRSLATTAPSAAELERARSEAAATMRKQLERPESIADSWLDIETFKLAPLADQARALSGVTPADVQRTAARLFRDAPVATVAAGSATQLRAEFERAGKVEVLGETSTPVKKPPLPPARRP